MLEMLAARGLITGAMKSFLGAFGVPLLILLAIATAAVGIDHSAYNRAKEQDRKAELERGQLLAAVVAKIDADLDQRLATIITKLGGKLATIDKERTIVQPIIRQELDRDPRLAAPDSCLSVGLLRAVNQARGYPAGADVGQARPANPRGVPGSPAGR